MDVPRRADRVAHVVQAVERGDQVVPGAAVGGRRPDLEADPLGHARLLRPAACDLDRSGVVVRADEGRVRERLGHQDRGRAVAAADVGHDRPALQLGHDPVQRGQPLGDQVRVVHGPEEPLAAVKHVTAVLVPAEPGAAAGYLGDLRSVEHRAQGDLEEPGQVRRAVRSGERGGLLGRQRIAAAVRVVGDIAARGLCVQPLAHVTLGGAGALREFRGRQRARSGQRAVQAELVAHHHERGVEGRADLLHGAEHELHKLVAVDLDGLVGGGHDHPPRSGNSSPRSYVRGGRPRFRGGT